MAFIETKHCPVCEQTTHHCNGKCSDCEHRKKLARIHEWNSMSYDERLNDLRKRVEEIERGPTRY